MTQQLHSHAPSARNSDQPFDAPADSEDTTFQRESTDLAASRLFALPPPRRGRSRPIVFRGTLPDPKKLPSDYQQVLADLTTRRPRAAARLKDLMSRIDIADDRLKELKTEAGNQRAREEKRILDEIASLQTNRSGIAEALVKLGQAGGGAAEPLVIPYGVEVAPMPAATADPIAPPASSPPVAGEPRPSIWSLLAAWKPAAKAPVADTTPVRLPFPTGEGAELAGPLENMAVFYHAPLGRAAGMSARHRWPILIRLGRGLALVACGSAFGLSVGVLTGLVEPKMIAIAPENAILPLSVVLTLGIALFMAIGRVVFLLAAVTSEERYEAWLLCISREAEDEFATTGESPRDRTHEWLARSANASFGVLVAVNVFLLAIESTCERYGVVRLVTDGLQNHQLVAGVAGGMPIPSTFALICLSLTVSAPFLLLESVEGWVDARERTIHGFLERHRLAAAHTHAKQMWEQRNEETAKAQSNVTESSGADEPTGNPQASEATPAPAAAEPAPKPTATTAQPPVVPEQETCVTPIIEMAPRPANPAAQLQAGIEGIDRRIKYLTDVELPKARTMLSAELADAWADCMRATHLFDEVFQRERRILDDEERTGVVARVWRRIAGYRHTSVRVNEDDGQQP